MISQQNYVYLCNKYKRSRVILALFHSNKLKQAVIKRYCRFLNIDINAVITQYEIDTTDNNFQRAKKDNLGKSFKKYLYIFMAAFITTLAWKFFA